MKKLKVEKYVNDQLDESFMVPLGLIRGLKAILPQSAINALQENQLDFKQIILASDRNKPYQTSLTCDEGGVMKRIVLTVVY